MQTCDDEYGNWMNWWRVKRWGWTERHNPHSARPYKQRETGEVFMWLFIYQTEIRYCRWNFVGINRP